MRYIVIPADVKGETIDGEPILDKDKIKKVFKFKDFIKGRLQDPKWGESLDTIEMGFAVRKKLRELKPEDKFFVLEDAHWRLLKETTEKPSKILPYLPEVMYCMMPFTEAICKAKNKDPAAVKKEEVEQQPTN